MLQHPLPSNCKFYVESHPPTLDINSHLQILCYTNRTKQRSINYKIDWRKRINGMYFPVTNVQGNSYICTSDDLGAYINAEITSLDPIYSGTTVLQFGPVSTPIPMGSLSIGIAGMFQSGNIPPQNNNTNLFGFSPMINSLPQMLSQAAQNNIPAQNVPPVNSHTVFLLGNGSERQCDLKFTENGMRIKDILTDYCYKFRVNRKGPRFQQNVSDPNRVLVTFNHKYVSDLTKFLRSFDDNRFVMRIGQKGSGIIELKFPTKQRKQTFMQAYQSIIADDAAKQRTQTAESLFKTSIYNPIKTNVAIFQDDQRPTKQSSKISMTNYSGPIKQAVKKNKFDDYTQGSLLNWMDNILQKDKLHSAKDQTYQQTNQFRVQNQLVNKQFDYERNKSIQRQRQRVIQVEQAQQRRISQQTNNIINMSLVLNELKRENQNLILDNQRLQQSINSGQYNRDIFQKQIKVKQQVIADAYSQLSIKQQNISKLQLEYEKLTALFRQSQKKSDSLCLELTQIRISEQRSRLIHNKQIEQLQQRISNLSTKNHQYQQQVAFSKQPNASIIIQNQKQLEFYQNTVQKLQNQLNLQTQQVQKLKLILSSQVGHSETQSILRAQIIELKHRLSQKQNDQIVQLKGSNIGSIELNKTKAQLLQLQTVINEKQVQIKLLKSTQVQHHLNETVIELQAILKQRQNEIKNLIAQIQMHRMKQIPSVRNSNINQLEFSQIKKIRNQYQNLTSIRNMLELRCESLLQQNHELQTLVQKQEFQIKFLQNNRQDPEIQYCKLQIDKMNNHIDLQQQEYSKLANKYELFKQSTQRKEQAYLKHIEELQQKLKNAQESSFDNNGYIPGNAQAFRRQNSMLVQENEKLVKHCQRLTEQAKDIPRLRTELIELRRKLINASEQNSNIIQVNEVIPLINSESIIKSQEKRFVISEILRD